MSIYAVNGKEPIAAWIPSLDTAGNGTTTLTDLVGSNNGTLTNMDAATDWVSDTSNGGVRALDFDGSDDFVEIADDVALQFGTGDFTISMWIYTRSTATSVIISKGYITSFEILSVSGYYQAYVRTLTGSASSRASFTLNSWQHLVLKRASGTITLTLDVADKAPFTSSGSVSSAGTDLLIGKRPGLAGFSPNSLIDDIRIFDTALDASDIAYLYNNGNGRGRTPSIYAVNGKDPIAAWIPSRDTAGNGTTTLTDLVGSNDGTLTNMDAATDWVSDTDAGGVRALDFDGSADVVTTSPFALGAVGTVSAWVYFRSVNSGTHAIIFAGGGIYVLINQIGTTVAFYWFTGPPSFTVSSAFTTGQWYHVAITRDGTNVRGYIDGVLVGNVAGGGATASSFAFQIGGWSGQPTRTVDGLIDDIRIFDTALDATDIAYLYNSGNGRGIIVESPSVPSAIYHPFASLKHPLTF